MSRKTVYADLDASIRTLLLAQIRNLWTHTSTVLEGNSLTRPLRSSGTENRVRRGPLRKRKKSYIKLLRRAAAADICLV